MSMPHAHCPECLGAMGTHRTTCSLKPDERLTTYGKAIWEASRADEGSISFIGANKVAAAVIEVADAELVALRAQVARVRALRADLAGYGPGTPMENVMGKQSITIETLLAMLDAALDGA